MVVLARRPDASALGQLAVAQTHFEGAGHSIDRDHVAVAQQADWTAGRSFRADMADAKTMRGTREPAVGEQRHLFADTLTVEGRRRRQHLAHTRPAAG